MSTSTNTKIQVSRVPSKPVRRAEDGAIAIDLWLCRDGVYDADAALRLTPAEAEVLHAQLCYALDVALIVPETSLPECRKSALRSPRR